MKLTFRTFILCILAFSSCLDTDHNSQIAEVEKLLSFIKERDTNAVNKLVAGNLHRIGITPQTLNYSINELANYIDIYGFPSVEKFYVNSKPKEDFKEYEVIVNIGKKDDNATLKAIFIKPNPSVMLVMN